MRKPAVLFLSGCLAFTVALTACNRAGEEKAERPQGPPEKYIRSTLGAGEHAKAVVGIAAIQKAIQMYQLQNGSFPGSLAELQSSGFLVQMPEAPVGKKYAYDAATGEVSVASKE